ncbi:MAG: saccharopine dehydrogenase NADP-binding domain-containing protein [Sphingobacteriales bacterium]|nr:MAG: saccharopine dehydrogenase NADP-binding domain-containing protein [Sphingobacteriales bacterium]
MKKILVLGAGKSATDLIHYLLQHAPANDWEVTVGDYDLHTALQKVGNHPNGRAVFFDVHDVVTRVNYISDCDIVASVLPANFHILVANDCLRFGKHLITPSYISPQERMLDEQFRQAGLLFMGEIGLDPGIDHLSLMKLIHHLRAQNAQITEVRSFCGALIAPESDNNPWHYKFTWAPMNVVLAGQGGTAQFFQNGKPRYIPYNRLFSQFETYEVEHHGNFEAYANRDSLPYRKTYQIEDVPTLLRGTLRKQGYCMAWQALIQIGLTDNQLLLPKNSPMTFADLTESFIPEHYTGTTEQRTAALLGNLATERVMSNLRWLGIFDQIPISPNAATPAQALLELLSDKWQLSPDDKDMIVMLHKVNYRLNGKNYAHTSTMVVKGKDADNTAIAATVGLPMAMMVKLVLSGNLQLTGVHIPTMPEVYEPILAELAGYGISFTDVNLEE